MLQVFVSSTWLDLQPERKAVEAALQRLRETKFVGMEYFGSRDESTQDASLAEVDRSHVYVGIFGGRYGSGITEDEYRRSRERGLPCFIYLKDEATIAPEWSETSPNRASVLAALKEDLRKAHTVTNFVNPDDLAAKVTADLHRWLFDEYLTPRLEKASRGEFPHEEAQSLLAAVKDLSQLNHELLDKLQSEGYQITAAGERSVAAQQIINSTIITGDVILPPTSIAPFQAEQLPEHFVDRREVSESLIQAILETTKSVSAIHGLGGSGKSVMASAVAHNHQVRSRFSDGVLWATLGQEPNLVSLLGGWVQAMGDYSFRPDLLEPTPTSAHLRSLLHEKAVFLIVDDVWDASDVSPFLVGGPRCHLLITTRDGLIAQSIGAVSYRLDEMTPEQSMELLSKRLGRGLKQPEHEPALALVQELGHLPLAINLAAAQVADGVPWSELLDELQTEIARLNVLDMPGTEEVLDDATRKRLSVNASFKLSLRRLPEERRQRFARLSVLAENVTFTPAIAATVWETNLWTARETLRYLRDKALISEALPPANGTPLYRLHNLMRDSARELLTSPVIPEREGDLPGSGVPLTAAHSELLKRYRDSTRDGLWHTLLDDGYIHSHLVWHLCQAEQFEEIHALLAEETADGRNGWFQTRDGLGQTGGYLEDLTFAWLLASGSSFASLVQSQLSSNVGLELRYALMISSVTSLAGSIPATLLARLVKTNPEQALAYALQTDPNNRINVLAELAPSLPQSLLKDTVKKIWATADDTSRLATLNVLLPYLPQSLIQEIYAASDAMREGYRLDFLVALAPRLPDEVKLKVLKESNDLSQARDNAFIRSSTLKALASCLPEPTKSAELQGMLERLEPPYADKWARGFLFFVTDLMLSPEALQSSKFVLSARQTMYAGLLEFPAAEDFSTMSFDQIRHWIFEGSNETDSPVNKGFRKYIFSSALQQFAPVFSELIGRRMTATQLEDWFLGRVDPAPPLARTIAECAIAQHIYWLAPHLPEAQLPEALRKSLGLEDDGIRFQALVALLPCLPPQPLKDEALKNALEIAQVATARNKVWALIDLAPHLSESQLGQALQLATSLKVDQTDSDEAAIAKAIGRMAPHFTASLIPEALKCAQAIENEAHRFEALTGLLPYLPDRPKTDVLDEVVKMARNNQSPGSQAQALARLAPELRESELEETLKLSQGIEHNSGRTEVLAALAPHLPDVLLPQALEIARAIGDDFPQSEVLSNLSFHLLNLDQHQEALAAARAIKDQLFRAEAITETAKHLSGQEQSDRLKESLEIARGIEPGFYRRRGEQLVESRGTAMTDVALLLREPLKGIVLQDALNSELTVRKGLNWQSAVLANLSVRLVESGYHQEAIRGARAINEWCRAGTLARIATYSPEPLKTDLLNEALEATRAARDEGLNIDPLPSSDHPQTDEGDSEFQFRFHVNIPPEQLMNRLNEDTVQAENRSVALAALVPMLSEPLLFQALTEASTLPENERIRVLVAIAPHLPEPRKTEVLETSLRIARVLTSFQEWIQVIGMLVPQLSNRIRLEVVQELLETIQTREADRFSTSGKQAQDLAQALISVARYLQGPLVDEALSRAYAIADPFWQGVALSGLAESIAQTDLPRAIAIVRRTRADSARSDLLSRLAPKLNEKFFGEALELTAEINLGYFSRQNLEYRINGGRSTFTTVWTAQIQALEGLARYLPSSCRMDLYRVWDQMIHRLAAGKRDYLLMHLYQSSVLFALGGAEAISEAARAIRDVGRWWP